MLAPSASGAQVFDNGESGPLPPLVEHDVRFFDTAHGLPVREVRGIEQAGDGYLYLATARGLYRFDGREFREVPVPFENSIVDQIHADSSGRLWALSGGLEVGYLHEGRFQVVGRLLPDDPGVEQLPIEGGWTNRTLWQTEPGAIWVAGGPGLVVVDPSADQPIRRFTVDDGLPSDTVMGVMRAPDGAVLAATAGGFARLEGILSGSTSLHFRPVGPQGVQRPVRQLKVVRADRNGVWLSQDRRLLRYRDGTVLSYSKEAPTGPTLDSLAWTPGWKGVIPRYFHDQYVPGHVDHGVRGDLSLVGKDSTIWIVSDRVLQGGPDRVYRIRSGTVSEVREIPPQQIGWVLEIHEDHEGNIWLATNQGLVQLVPQRVFTLSDRFDLDLGFTTAVLQTRDRSVWIGTWGGGLFRFQDGELDERIRQAEGLYSDRVRALYETEDGELWAGTRTSAQQIAGTGSNDDLRVSDEARALAPGPDGELWVASADGAFVNRGDGWERIPVRSGAGPGGLWSAHHGPSGSMWFGGEGGVYRLADDSLMAVVESPKLANAEVIGIHELSDGSLWFATYQRGIHRWRGGRFAAVTSGEGLHDDGIWGMVEDGLGGVWMSSDGGIARVERDRLHAVADAIERGKRADPLLAPRIFGLADGMLDLESNRASPAAFRLDDGTILFNNREGVVVVDPERALRPLSPSPTVIDSLVVDGEALSGLDHGVALDGPPRHLVFYLKALSFAFPEEVRYRYRLDGYDEGWVQGGGREVASYTNLPPGEYAFRVESRTRHGSWQGSEASVSFVIPPLMWQTTWFRVLLVLVVLGLVFLAHHLRLSRALRLQRMRLRIASDLHDDVGSSLTSIALLSEMVAGQDSLDALSRRQLRRIRTAAESTVESLRDVIWLVDPAHDDLPDLVRRMQRAAEEIVHGIPYDFEVTSELPSRQLSMTFRRNVFLLFKEALHNVVKHSETDRVHIEVCVENGELRLRVRDFGVGLALDEPPDGYGLKNMKRRAEECDGELEIRHREGGGTEVALAAPLF